MNFKKYHVSRNLIDIRDFTATTTPASRDGILWTGTLAEGTYTFSINQDDTLTSSLRNTIHIRVGSTNYYENATPNYHNNSGRHSYTFTVPDATTTVTIYYWTNTISNDCSFSQGMLNTGSTALPYEPYSSEVWHDIPYYQHKTATDTPTLPAVIYPNDTSITVGIKGQSSQSGTPTPSNPVDVNGTGERTGNLYNINAHDVNNGYVNNAKLNQDGTTETWGSAEISEYIPISGDTAYTFNGIGSYNSPCYGLYDENKQLIGAYKYNGRSTINFTSPNNARYFRFTRVKAATQAMTVEGTYISSTMPEFEPYGYKIPISMGGTTTPVYLGEVETTRKIQKWVLNGTEEGWKTTGGFFYNGSITPDYLRSVARTAYCTHYQAINNVTSGSSVGEGECAFYSSVGVQRLYFKDSNYSTIAEFKQHLADEYANGTPVTIWYVLATPTTATVNEPLMKIGTYADSLTTSIPCTAGENTLDVQTTVQPSEVTATFEGWHAVEDVHERENGQWD